MANDFYEVNTDLQPFTRARSSVLDAEFAGIESGFEKLPSQSRLLSGNSNFVTAGGAANAITVSAPTTWTAYTGKDGYRLSIKITTANTGSVTLNVDGLGAKACVRLDGDALEAGDLQVNGVYDFFYNNSTGKFHVAAWNSFVTAAETAATNAASSEASASASASSASSSAASATTSATASANYATKTDDFASGSDNSAKSWAIGGTGNGQPSSGSAKDWATKAEDSTVDGTNFSALHHAAKAAASAASVNLPNITGNATKVLRAKSDESGLEYFDADSRFAQLSGGSNANFSTMPQVGGNRLVESGGFHFAGEGARDANSIAGDDPHWLEVTNNPGDGATGNQLFRMNSYGDSAYGNNIHSCRYYGDLQTPTAIGNGAFLMSWGFRGYDGSELSQSAAAFQCLSTEAWNASSHGSKFRLEVTPNGSTSRELMSEVTQHGISVGGAVTPGWHQNYRVVEISGKGTAIRGHVSQPEVALTNNAFYDTAYEYGATGFAQTYLQTNNGQHLWQSAPFGSAGGAITMQNVMEIDENYDWHVDSTKTSGSGHSIRKQVASDAGNLVVDMGNNTSQSRFYAVSQDGANAANAALKVNRDGVTSRSINAGGTINASGADYAEYMRKSDGCGVIPKGGVVGINGDGMLTDKYSESVSFAIKSTNPSYVGGDTWGSPENLGLADPNHDDVDYEQKRAEFMKCLEAERLKWDRIAFCGQVPVDASAQVGDYLVPLESSGKITVTGVSNPTFEQYVSSVGKVIKIGDDGRPIVIVKTS
ncbi:hypothetical protein ACFQH5_20195 [Halomonas salifodinae]|uniref:Tail fiber protein n=1 Tax=Halomonas salifodinae TaxID=438745 RepID=A0ABW2F751_9GAMM